MNVLAIGAHPDDIELGCGGALLAHRRAGDTITLLVMTSGELGSQGDAPRVLEQEESADLLHATLRWGGFEDGLVPEDRHSVSLIESVAQSSQTDMIYTHALGDTHQDHRATHGATLAAARRASRVLCYESPSTTSFTPNLYVDLDDRLEDKLELLRSHISQVLRNGPVDLDAVEAQARFRGFQARRHHAEAFETHRFVWTPLPADQTGSAAGLIGEQAHRPGPEDADGPTPR